MDIKDFWIIMQEWKARQNASQLTAQITGKKHRDDLTDVPVLWRPENIVEDALRHFNERVDEWIYPAKSYFVAICYANWIAQEFDEDFLDVLNDPNLLPDDPYYIPYTLAPGVYDAILEKVVWDEDMGMIPDVREYFDEEFLIGQL